MPLLSQKPAWSRFKSTVKLRRRSAVATLKHRPSKRKAEPKETFWYLHEMYVFDVDRANALIVDGREPVEVEEESIRMSLAETAKLTPDHIPTVDPTRPGIIAHVEFEDDGQVFRGHVLIDGNHRAARCLELERPFFAFVLTLEESREILIRSPLKADKSPGVA